MDELIQWLEDSVETQQQREYQQKIFDGIDSTTRGKGLSMQLESEERQKLKQMIADEERGSGRDYPKFDVLSCENKEG